MTGTNFWFPRRCSVITSHERYMRARSTCVVHPALLSTPQRYRAAERKIQSAGTQSDQTITEQTITEVPQQRRRATCEWKPSRRVSPHAARSQVSSGHVGVGDAEPNSASALWMVRPYVIFGACACDPGNTSCGIIGEPGRGSGPLGLTPFKTSWIRRPPYDRRHGAPSDEPTRPTYAAADHPSGAPTHPQAGGCGGAASG